MEKDFINWMNNYSSNILPGIAKKYHAVVDEAAGMLVDIVVNTPADMLELFIIESELWLDDYRLLTGLTTEEVFYREQDVDEIFSVLISDVPYAQLKAILDTYQIHFSAAITAEKKGE